MDTYEVNVYRDGRWWMIADPGARRTHAGHPRGGHRQGATDYVALTCDVPPSQVKVNVHGAPPPV